MSKQTPTARKVFESVVEAYFYFTMDESEQGMKMNEAITLACEATGRKYNSSMYTRWREKSPQQDVLKFMQLYVSKQIVRQSFPEATEQEIRILVNNLSLPVTDEQNRNIAKYFN